MNPLRSVLLRRYPPWRSPVAISNEFSVASDNANNARARYKSTKSKNTDSLHIPVMKDEVLNLWLPSEERRDSFSSGQQRPVCLVDGTIGLGGHSLAAVHRSTQRHDGRPVRILGIDRDPTALAKSRRRAERELTPPDDDCEDASSSSESESEFLGDGERTRSLLSESDVKFHCGSFAELSPGLLSLYGFPLKVHGMLVDLGMNSFQIENKDRGFSFRRHGPLDMRFDVTTKSHLIREGQELDKLPGKSIKARDIVNTWSADDLSHIFRTFADEPYADEIALAIVEWRSAEEKRERKAPVGIRTTLELRYVVEEAVAAILLAKGVEPAEKFPPNRFYAMWRAPTKKLKKKTKDKLLKRYAEMKTRHSNHVMRVFQALRIEVNDELKHVKHFFDRGIAARCLEAGGRLVMIAFQPGEDAIVREGMEDMVSTGEFVWATPAAEGLRPTLEEVKSNGRSRSARLRAVERVR